MWLDEDVDAALDWQTEQDLKCPGCGLPRDETTDEDGPDYRAHSTQCRACQARDIHAHDVQRDAADAGTRAFGFYFGVQEVTDG